MIAVYAVIQEAECAHGKHGDFRSTHEALGVLIEEVRELEDAIRANSMQATAREAMQVSAVALRLHDVCLRAIDGDAPEFKDRSGA